MKSAQHTDSAFLAAVRDANLETLIASGNLQLIHALQELNQLRTRERFTEFFSPGSDPDADSLFGPVLGTRISPGGNHLVYRVHCPPSSKAQQNSLQDSSEFFLDDTTLVDINMNTMHEKK